MKSGANETKQKLLEFQQVFLGFGVSPKDASQVLFF
jgi:hypothetical protein